MSTEYHTFLSKKQQEESSKYIDPENSDEEDLQVVYSHVDKSNTFSPVSLIAILIAAIFLALFVSNLLSQNTFQSSKFSTQKNELSSKKVSISSQSPNIIFILVNDMGFNSIGYNQKDLTGATPFLNSLMSKDGGLSFSNYYAQEECTPSR